MKRRFFVPGAVLLLVVLCSKILLAGQEHAEHKGWIKPGEAQQSNPEFPNPESAINNPQSKEVIQKTQKLQMPFIANEGQVDEQVAFYSKTFGGTVFVTKDGEIVYSLPKVQENIINGKDKPPCLPPLAQCSNLITQGWHGQTPFVHAGIENESLDIDNYKLPISDSNHDISTQSIALNQQACTDKPVCPCHPNPNNPQSETHNPQLIGLALKEELVGAKISGIKGEGEAVTKVSYFKGNDPSRWKSNISTYDMVNLGEVYKGIELKLKAHGNNVEKLFYVKPGADPGQIRVMLSGINLPNPPNPPLQKGGFGVSSLQKENKENSSPLLKENFPLFIEEDRENSPSLLKEDQGNFSLLLNRNQGTSPPLVKGDQGGLYINNHGELEVETELGTVTFTKPVAYQEIDGKRVEVDVEYSIQNSEDSIQKKEFPCKKSAIQNLKSDNRHESRFIYGFTVASYDKTKELIIDPLLASTYLGGSDFESGVANIVKNHSLSIDSGGNVYIVGITSSSDFPTTMETYDNSYNGGLFGDVFVSKFNSDLTNLLASTYLGGSSSDLSGSIAIDANGNIYVTGRTHSSDFPATTGAYDTSFDGNDVFISKFNGDLTSLLSSTSLGGSDTDGGNSIILNTSGNVYITGWTSSSDFPITQGAYDTSFNGGIDYFISKLNENLQNLLASTYLGGSDNDYYHDSFSLDTNENLYITGYTLSSDFPTTPDAYDTSFNGGSTNFFVSKLNETLTNLLASTFLGKSNPVSDSSTAIDSNGNVYVVGMTDSSDFPTTPDAYDTSYNEGYGDAFISKLNNDLTSLLASTFLGGTSQDIGRSIAIDKGGNIYITGNTKSSDFPTTHGAYDTSFDSDKEVFVSKINENLTNVLASTYLGGSSGNLGYSLAIDSTGNIYVTGMTTSSDFPTTPSAYSTSYNGGFSDAFVSKLDSNLSANPFNFSFSTINSPQAVGVPFEVTITAKDICENIKTDFNGEVILSATIGRVSPTKTSLTNGSKTLNLTLDSPGNNIKILANGGGKSGQSEAFNVTGGVTNLASIGGVVKNSAGSRISGATVHLDDDTTTTDNNGTYQFKNLIPGEYTIKASLDDKESMSYKINLQNQCLTMDLDLLGKSTGVIPILLVPGVLGSSTEDGYPTLPAMCLAWNSSKWNKSGLISLYYGMLDPINIPMISQEVGWKSLVEALHSNDFRYEIGTTIFPVPYDWRMKIDDIAKGYLKPWIDEAKRRTDTSTVNIIAHSMGGLVVRAYIQSSDYENDIDKFAMVGTPNHGAGVVYYIWEGGDLSLADHVNGTKLYSEAFNNIYKEMNGNKPLPVSQTANTTPMVIMNIPLSPIEVRDFVHDYVPSIRQLLPIYLFLQSGNTIKYIKDTDSINNDLIELNESLNMKGVNTKIFGGTNQNTISIINVGQPNALYKDGRPMGNPDKITMGDGNVLLTSALLPNFSIFLPAKTGEHASLIKIYMDDLVEFITGIKLSGEVAHSIRSKTRNILNETTSLNGLVVSVRGRVQPYIVDPQGRKSGINPITNQREEEIPDSIISMDVDGGSISIEDAMNGTSTLYLKGGYNEDYRLIFSYVDDKKSIQKEYLCFNHANTTAFTFTINSLSKERIVINHSPLAPTNLQANAVDAEGLKTKLTWKASSSAGVTSYNIYSREDDEPYLKLIGNTNKKFFDTGHPWVENASIKTRVYAVSAVKEDNAESFLSNMVENNDRDHDGLTDEKETSLGTDIDNPDSDGDTLKDGAEYVYSTDPLKVDTDEDFYSDYVEVRAGSDPLGKDSIPSILGSVVKDKGNPLGSVSIKLWGKKTRVSMSTVSDTKGFFGFANLGEDTYWITATKAGYRKAVKKVTLQAGEVKEMWIHMKYEDSMIIFSQDP